MNADQKKVAIGAVSGVVGMALLVFILYSIFPTISGMDTVLGRLSFTLQLNVFAVIPFFIMLVMVGNERFFSNAIDPLRHAEDKLMEINGRVADNTLQQNFTFCIGTLALSTFLTSDTMKIIPALVTVFILARVIFWIGYRINPLYRAPGMAATSYMNLSILLAVVYLFFF
ncbi:MAPEG family protein [Candidatus Kaiserbacteria bacterium]|nr:MAPEG family protein [Candidatus Kaiserbacteria bacterium]